MTAEELYRLRRSISNWDDDFDEPEVSDVSGLHGNFQLVGNGKVTNQFCGCWVGLKGCLNIDGHEKVAFDKDGILVNYSGKVFIRKVHHFCNKPSCPVCYRKGWAVRQAGSIEGRLIEASKLFGQIEHIIASVPSSDYGLELGKLRQKVIKALKVRGVIGGNLIFHGFRFEKPRGWYWSPHFHVLGFISGGYGKCRNCENKVCVGYGNFGKCNGFEARTRRLNVDDGYIVKVKGERKTIFGTAWYQLNHSSYKKGASRFHVNTWFGVVSYRKFKFTIEAKKELCPICSEELVKLRYFGSKIFVTDMCSLDYKRDSLEDFEEDGVPVWFEVAKPKYVSGSYEDLVGHDY